MRLTLLAATALALASFGSAHADTIFDSINTQGTNSGQDGLPDDTIALADSFSTASLGPTTVTLQVSAQNPGDGGSTLVYLVPNSGSTSAGVAGSPTYSTSGTPAYDNGFQFTGSQQIGTILDSSLAQSGGQPSLVSFTFRPTITTSNNEWWIGIVGGAGSSLNWSYEETGTGIGLANQANFYYYNTGSGSNTFTSSIDPDIGGANGGAYGMIVTTSEPMSIAVIGAALTGLGVVRRRSGKARPA